MTSKNDTIQRLVDAINSDSLLSLYLEIKQNEDGEWVWRYTTITSLWDTGELYDSREELIIGLIKWFVVNLNQHDDLIYSVINRVERRQAE